jgi:signal transduction histidine kinase
MEGVNGRIATSAARPGERMEASNPLRENARLLFSIRALADFSAEIASAHDFETTAKSSLMMILGAVSAAKGILLHRDASGARLETTVYRGLPASAAVSLHLPDGVVEELRRTSTAMPIAGRDGADGAFAPWLAGHLPQMAVYAPLVVREELLGVLAIGPKLTRQPYSEGDLELIFTLATMLASGIHSHHLIQGLQETNQRLRDTQEQLIRTERLATLGELSAGIAHEVKNPLTSIRGFAGTIAETVEDSSPEEIREFAQIIVDATYELQEIIDEVRDYAKGVRRTYEAAPVALSALVDETLSFTKFSRELRAVELRKEVEEDAIVFVNRDKLKQVLINLLRNATQALTDPHRGRIVFRVTTSNGWGRIEVSDNGRGIPADAREKIWENWYTTKGAEGTGLGLGRCREIVENHGGTLELVKSEVGVGTTFAICLPLAETLEEDAAVGAAMGAREA